MEVLHTHSCSARHAIAEMEIKKTLHTPDCPRCILNNAAPALLEACESIFEALDNNGTIDRKSSPFDARGTYHKQLKAAIVAAEGK